MPSELVATSPPVSEEITRQRAFWDGLPAGFLAAPNTQAVQFDLAPVSAIASAHERIRLWGHR
jgi:hypothetical protein